VQPDIRYARSGGVAIAYQVVGDGDADVDLVYIPDYLSNLVYGWSRRTRGASTTVSRSRSG
jgi:hypothetical protein